MKNKKTQKTQRNWVLVFVASVLIVIGLVLVYVAVTNISTLGWLSLGAGLLGLATIFASIMSIVQNDPSWILLSIIIPG